MKISTTAVASSIRKVEKVIRQRASAGGLQGHAPYVQVVPIFFKSDGDIFRYFGEHVDEIDAITGNVIHVVLPRSVLEGDAKDVASAVEASERYPGLKAADLPCLWVEGAGNQAFVIRLPPDLTSVKQVLYGLVDNAREASTFEDVARSYVGAAPDTVMVTPSAGRRVVCSIHGIKTRGAWQKELQASFDQARAGLEHRPLDFGLFGALALLIPALRDRKIAWFLDQYTRIIKEEQLGSTPPSIIAHSFGTYIVAQAMERYPEIRFDRLVMCGSIVRRDYPWSHRARSGQIIRALNDFGRRDIWVRVAEWVVADAGSSGYEGFSDTADNCLVQRRHETWRHSDYFYRLNYERNWIPFIIGAHDPDEGQEEGPRAINWRFVAVRTLVVLAVASGAVYAIARWWPG